MRCSCCEKALGGRKSCSVQQAAAAVQRGRGPQLSHARYPRHGLRPSQHPGAAQPDLHSAEQRALSDGVSSIGLTHFPVRGSTDELWVA